MGNAVISIKGSNDNDGGITAGTSTTVCGFQYYGSGYYTGSQGPAKCYINGGQGDTTWNGGFGGASIGGGGYAGGIGYNWNLSESGGSGGGSFDITNPTNYGSLYIQNVTGGYNSGNGFVNIGWNNALSYVTSNLVNFYSFAFFSCFISGTTTINDISNNTNLTLTNPGTYYPGSTGYMTWTATTSASGTLTNFTYISYTLEILVFPTSFTGSNLITLTGTGGTNNLFINSSGYVCVGSSYVTTSNQLITNTWYHIVVIYTNSTTISVYINNVLATGSGTGSVTSNPTSLILGSQPGNIALVRIYGTTLTNNQVGLNYTMVKSLIPTYVTNSLLGYWDFNNSNSYSGTGTSLNDLSVDGYNLTINNIGTYNSTYMTFANNTYALCNNNPTFNFINGFTLEVLIYVSTFSSYLTLLSFAPAPIVNNTTYTFALQSMGSSGTWGVYSSVNANYTITSGLLLNQWIHLVFTCTSSGTYSGYSNNTFINTGTGLQLPKNQTFPLTLGNYLQGNGNKGLPCNYAMARIYNRNLSATEIAQNYYSLRNINGNPYNLT